jgi:hypothetical protein
VTLDAGEPATIEVQVTSPLDAGSVTDVTTVFVVSQHDSLASDTAMDTTRIRYQIFLPLIRK